MASTIKVDNVQNQPGTNIIDKCGTTITLGQSGDTVSLASGASQTGFGRTGTVDWETTPKTGDFTAVNGKGYFVNTTSGGVTMTMPSGAAGSIVSIQDYNKTFDSNSLTITPASGEKINGGTADGDLIISTEGQGLTFVYVDSTVGWKTVHENDFTGSGSSFIVATGGSITTSGDYKIHTFTGPGTFCVSGVSPSAPDNAVDYLVIAGGGAGGANDGGGGGGAGGYRESPGSATGCYTVSPRGAAPATAITVTATGYPITVGSGGSIAPPNGPGGNGSDSTFSTITGTGGGGGAQFNLPVPCGGGPKSGGSGGGGGGRSGCVGSSGGAASPVTNPVQGTAGGPATPGTSPGSIDAGGGGGGALCAGAAGAPNGPGGVGGAGGISSINGTPTARAGGGGAGSEVGAGGAGGNGGGGAGVSGTGTGTSGTVNTGGGGGGKGTGTPGTSGTGGSGIIILRYKYQ
jgi:hypothetical protein